MKKQSLNSLSDLSLAYSTDKNYAPPKTEFENPLIEKSNQIVRVQLSTKLKGGKTISRIYGLEETLPNLELLCKFIKNKCGAGGTIKDNEIIIQGNHVDKIIKILIEEGYRNTKRSGG